MKELNMQGRRVNFLLCTVGQEKIVPAYALARLEVADLNAECYYQLPEVLTQETMSVSSDNIIKPKDLAHWPHLSGIQIPRIKAKVELLIGSNAPKILEPWEVVTSCGEGPYAIKTVLGWIVNGPMQDKNISSSSEMTVAAANMISVCHLGKLLHTQYMQKSLTNSLETAEKQIKAKEELLATQEQDSAQHIGVFKKEQGVHQDDVNQLKQEIQIKNDEVEKI